MDERVVRALSRGHRIDITTTGRRTGLPRRIEIVFHNIDGRIYISGTPHADRVRAWIHNLSADPNLTFHLKGAVQADLPATARIVTDEVERRRVCEWIVANAWPNQDAEAMTAYAPLIEIAFADKAA
jgi:deazaflavin-dependent oxidoreductase (nitroreductase family)